jgi:biopolymer transport protein ExbB/TolQ
MEPTALVTPPVLTPPLEPASAQLSPLALLLAADPVVKAVMLLLVAASVASWAIAFETGRRQRILDRKLRAAEAGGLLTQPALAEIAMRGEAAVRLAISRETGGEWRARVERAIREAGAGLVVQTDAGLTLLATTASTAPFVGLFGTVWGVMNSFSAIAGANDTSLATVAPGIAEALFTTAVGLFAAIPAAVAYNRLGSGMRRLTARLNRIARDEAEAAVAHGKSPAQAIRRPSLVQDSAS